MTKTTLTNIQRREICLKKQENPNITKIKKDLVEWCKQTLRVEVDQVTILILDLLLCKRIAIAQEKLI